MKTAISLTTGDLAAALRRISMQAAARRPDTQGDRPATPGTFAGKPEDNAK